MLNGDNFEIIEAKDGMEGRNLIDRECHNLHLILLDYLLPLVSGLEVYKHIQADPLLQKIPLVLMSGYINGVIEEIPQPWENFEFIKKPFDNAKLNAAIISAIAKSRARELSISQFPPMNNNPNQPREFDAVLGGQNSLRNDAAVLGGLEGVKKRLNNPATEERIAALPIALNYGEEGLNLIIQALNDKSWQVEEAAYLLLRDRAEPNVMQAVREYLQSPSRQLNSRIFAKVQRVLSASLKIEANRINVNTDIIKNLHANDLDIVAVVLALESEFHIEIDDSDIEQITTVQKIVDCVIQKLHK
jgi:acyl carrier protein